MEIVTLRHVYLVKMRPSVVISVGGKGRMKARTFKVSDL